MKFVLEIELGNDAMQTGADVSTALRTVAIVVDEPEDCWDPAFDKGVIHDTNGNIVGKWEVQS